MPDRARITTLVVDQIEDYIDAQKEAFSDGTLTADEDLALTGRLQQLHTLAMDADEGIGLAVTMLRCGPESPSLKRRMVERGLRLMKGGHGRSAA